MEASAHHLCTLLRSELEGVCVSCEFSDDEARRLYALAKRHDLAHLVTAALERCGRMPEGELGELFARERLLAVYRCGRQTHGATLAMDALAAAGIAYVPLKGAVIRPLYPEPWMRTCCDVDILVREEDLDRAVAAIGAACGLVERPHRKFHDVLLCLDPETHVELHFSLREGYEAMDAVLARAWEYAVPEEGYRYRLLPEFLIFYHIAHMAHHFLHGGCGLRPFLDLYLLERSLAYDASSLDALLSKARLLTFAAAAREAVATWLGGVAPTERVRQMGDYLFPAGAYGLLDNRVAIGAAGKSRFRYILGRIFLPYAVLSEYYPTLRGRRLLTPWYQVRRWCAILKKRARRRGAFAELRRSAALSDGQAARMSALLAAVGLDKEKTFS